MPQFCNLASGLYAGVGKYGIPQIEPISMCETNTWIGFNYVKAYSTKKDKNTGVHFFLDDYRFERVWNVPDKYLTYLSRYAYVLSPDFSLYSDFPLAVQIYNHYRKHWLAAYWQNAGIKVIPTISWSTEDSFEWCFDGEPTNSVVAVSDLGCRRTTESREAFNLGYTEMLNRLNPSKILVYTRSLKREYAGNVKYIRYGIGVTEAEI